MSGEDLERLFVARHHILDAVLARVVEAGSSNSRNHTLLVGPRGAGKTHLVALIHHRVRALIADGLKVQLSWLPEDPWTIVSLRHLLAEIARRLEPTLVVPDRADAPTIERLLLHRARQGGPIVVLVENLDQVFDQIDEDGQRRLRHLLQVSGALLLVGTTTTLDRNLSDQAQPFYGFFSTTRLLPLTVPEAAVMLARLAADRDDSSMVDYLGTDEARSRLQTVEHLAGGQPRLWAALGSSLTVDGLRDLVDLLMERFDDLTPYYQGQLAQLSPQQRLIVAELASSDHAMHVAEISTRTDQGQRSVASAVGVLVERGWLHKVETSVLKPSDGRRSYYELGEPLLRVAFQLKEARGEPVRLVVDFLKGWFDPDTELAATAGLAAYATALANAFATDPVGRLAREVSGLPGTEAPALNLRGAVDDALTELAAGSADGLLELPSPLRRAIEVTLWDRQPSAAWLAELRLDIHQAAVDEVLASFVTDLSVKPLTPADATVWIERGEDLVTSSRGLLACRANLVDWLALGGRSGEAEQVLVLLLAEYVGVRDGDVLTALRLAKSCLFIGAGLLVAGEHERAIQMAERASSAIRDVEGNFEEQFKDALDDAVSRIEQVVRSMEGVRTTGGPPV